MHHPLPFPRLSSCCLIAAQIGLLSFLLLSPIFPISGGETTDPSPRELDRYLTAADDSFRWSIVGKQEKENEHTILVDMVSQTWHDIPWKHYLLIALPNQAVSTDHAVLYIGGKRIGRKPGEGDTFLARSLAESTGMPVGMLFQVPNQPLLGNYSEDALIGETMLKAIETEDTTWPLLFPMAKSALRAMDAVQQVLRKEQQISIDHFVVTGASKRGWTTWLTAASKDQRVKAIVPIVIDLLNIRRQMDYQIESWGAYSPSIHDYTDRKLVHQDDSKLSEFERNLWTMIDPYSYRSRFTMPKLLVHGTNDPYWALDSARHYWDDLPGVKYLLTLPNAGHGLDGQQIKAVQSIAVFARHAAAGGDWPGMDWTLEEQENGYTVVVRSDLPKQGEKSRVKLWSARSETKDFRQAKWSSQTIETGIERPIVVAKPKSGHVAFYVELTSTQYGMPFSLTTQVWRF